MSNHNVWKKPYPNHLGDLAAEKREAATDLAKLQQMRTALSRWKEELLAMRARCQEFEWKYAYAHVVDADEAIARLISKGPHDAA